jgi:hypothetical protein
MEREIFSFSVIQKGPVSMTGPFFGDYQSPFNETIGSLILTYSGTIYTNIMILGASYGSLLSTKLPMPGTT